MNATISETANAAGEWSTQSGSADAIASGHSSLITTQNDTAYTRNVPHGSVSGWYGSGTNDWSSYHFETSLTLADDEWGIVSGEGYAAAGQETGVYFAAGAALTLKATMARHERRLRIAVVR